MGQEINASQFTAQDFSRFLCRLNEETDLLGEHFKKRLLSAGSNIGGFELEAWLIDGNGQPAPVNQQFLRQVNNALVVPELAAFNVELNSHPAALQGDALAAMEKNLAATWSACQETAADLNAHLIMIGILPSVTQQQLSLKNMSSQARYRALNEQVFKLRHGEPLHLHIEGQEVLKLTHHDVMLEAGTTSLQIHLQVPADKAHHYLNLAQIFSAPMVAMAANSPYLFGHDLWQESRIPLFEQAVEVGSPKQRRVTFGNSYVAESIFECFRENLESYPVLVPIDRSTDHRPFPHLRFHNGTIWRWNRPLIGVETEPAHVRIEHRVVAAGPSVVDSIANVALFYGLSQCWAGDTSALIDQIDFPTARTNFYKCARYGLDAEIEWQSGKRESVQRLLLNDLLPQARQGLQQLCIDETDVNKYLGVLESRIASGTNGAAWQRQWVARHGRDMTALTLAYYRNQESGRPVHEWPL